MVEQCNRKIIVAEPLASYQSALLGFFFKSLLISWSLFIYFLPLEWYSLSRAADTQLRKPSVNNKCPSILTEFLVEINKYKLYLTKTYLLRGLFKKDYPLFTFIFSFSPLGGLSYTQHYRKAEVCFARLTTCRKGCVFFLLSFFFYCL